MIELRGVSRRYDGPEGGIDALSGLSLQLRPGCFTAVVGKSGSGKSTLLSLVAGIDRPSSGEVLVAGQALHTLDESALATWRGRNVGVVFQFFQLLPTLTVLENVMLPMDFCATLPTGQARERALMLLGCVGIADQAHKLPLELSVLGAWCASPATPRTLLQGTGACARSTTPSPVGAWPSNRCALCQSCSRRWAPTWRS